MANKESETCLARSCHDCGGEVEIKTYVKQLASNENPGARTIHRWLESSPLGEYLDQKRSH